MEGQNEITIDQITEPFMDITYNATYLPDCVECSGNTFDISSGSTCLCNYEKVVLGVMYRKDLKIKIHGVYRND